MRRLRPLFFLLAAAVSFVTPTTVQARDDADRPRGVFGEVIDVRVVNLEVDPSSRPISSPDRANVPAKR